MLTILFLGFLIVGTLCSLDVRAFALELPVALHILDTLKAEKLSFIDLVDTVFTSEDPTIRLYADKIIVHFLDLIRF